VKSTHENETCPPALRTLASVVHSARQPMFIAWGADPHLLCNDACVALLGIACRDAWEALGPFVAKAAQGAAMYRDDITVFLPRERGLRETHLGLSCTPVHDDGGGVLAVLCVCAPGRVVAAEQALQHSDDRFRAAIAAIGVLWTNDAAGRMTGEQPGWGRLTGQSRAEYEGFGWSDAVHPEDAADTVDAWKRAVAGHSTFIHEHRVRRRDGRWRRFAVRAVPVFEADGSVREWVGVHIDITEAAEAAEALRRADRRKDEFLATLAHELRNPLAPIRTAAHLLDRPGIPPDRVAWCSDLIRRQSRTMAMLLDDLLDVSRITGGRLELRRGSVSVRSVVDAAVETAQPLIDARRHALELQLAPGLPLLDVDSLRVAQILTNLLTNAAKYTDPGGRIRLSARPHGEEVEFEVSDNGIGIAPESLPEVFEMFRQVQGTQDRSAGGLGIGLALTKGLVELHGGRIEVSSEGPRRGATFRVLLPACAEAPHAESPPRRREHDPRAASGHKVLVVDDNLDAARTLAMVLEVEGYEVHLAHDGIRALDLAERVRPAAALLDIGMPGLDGYRLAAKLRAQPWGAGMTLVATTGWGQPEDKRRAAAAGFDAHLTKPVNPEAVLSLLRHQLERESATAAPPVPPSATPTA
jgi:PAS domain S-box-containing protein